MARTTITLFLILLQSQLTRAQVDIASPPGNEPTTTTNDYSYTTRPREVIIVAVVSTFLFVGFYFIYLCFCLDELPSVSRWSSWRPWNFGGSLRHILKSPHGLDPSIVKSFPTFEYSNIKSAMIGKGALECAICLAEFNDKDALRLIPKCDHVFHVDCVDEWLISHATCPVCRLNLTDIDTSDHVYDIDTILQVDDDNCRAMRRLSRSLSTGHVAVKQWERMDKFTLRLPLELRKQLITGESSSSRRFGNAKVRKRGKSDSWVFSLAPSLFKASFRKQVYKAEGLTGTSREGSMRGSFRARSIASTSQEGSSLRGVPDDELV